MNKGSGLFGVLDCFPLAGFDGVIWRLDDKVPHRVVYPNIHRASFIPVGSLSAERVCPCTLILVSVATLSSTAVYVWHPTFGRHLVFDGKTHRCSR